MKILLACEESQAVTKEFRKLGHESFSCDIIECSGGHPEWHYQCHIQDILYERWDMVIAFPPCTHLAVSGARWFPEKVKDGRQQRGIDFFMMFALLNCDKIAIENPVGILSTKWRKPDQYIQPWEFGHTESKKTGIWLKGLPLLKPTDIVYDEMMTLPAKDRNKCHYASPGKDRAKTRSKTYPGVAKAMAEQWGSINE